MELRIGPLTDNFWTVSALFQLPSLAQNFLVIKDEKCICESYTIFSLPRKETAIRRLRRVFSFCLVYVYLSVCVSCVCLSVCLLVFVSLGVMFGSSTTTLDFLNLKQARY